MFESERKAIVSYLLQALICIISAMLSGEMPLVILNIILALLMKTNTSKGNIFNCLEASSNYI